jgi:penicillin-binding protein 1C
MSAGRLKRRVLMAAAWCAFCVVAAFVLLEAAIRLTPLPAELRRGGAPGVGGLDARGRPLRETPNNRGLDAAMMAESAAPEPLVAATLAAEDARFWRHPGVDWRASLRAAWQCIRWRRVVSGGSTITQQLVKMSHPRPRTVASKIIEAVQALRLEREWDKEQILAEYLRRLDYGNQCEGLVEASRQYFGKRPSELSLAEAAFLAGIPQAPSRLNPRRRPERARVRREWILGRCRNLGFAEPDAVARALTEPVHLAPPSRSFLAPHFVDFARARMPAGSRPGAVRTTLDLDVQRRAESALRAQLVLMDRRGAGNGAVVVLDNRTGAVLAMVGSRDWADPAEGRVNGALALRSPGSALKPFVYLLAIRDGATAADVIADTPAEFPTPTGIFRPVNYNQAFAGPVRLREALACSLNVPAVRTLDAHGGPAALMEALRACGVTSLNRSPADYGLGLALGGGEVSLLELANAYATLGRRGVWRPFRWLESPAPDAAAERSTRTPAGWCSTSFATRSPAPPSSGWNPSSGSIFRWPAKRGPVPTSATIGPSASPLNSPWASGLATSTDVPCPVCPACRAPHR